MKALIALIIIFTSAACGVKGKPLPPLTAPPLGRGEPTFKKATDLPSPRKPRQPIPDDWEEAEDF